MSKTRAAPTMQDIGRAAGVAAITVSRALRGDPAVRPETRKQVLRKAKEFGYIPNHAARAFSQRGSKLIALVVPNVSNSVFAETIDGLTDRLTPAGFSLIIGYSGYSKEHEEVLVQTLLGYKPDGIVLTGFTHTAGTRSLLRRATIPVVEMWNVGMKAIDMAVGFSNFDAAKTMTEYLLSKGHRRIAYAGGTQTDNDRTQARELGFRRAMEEAGLSPDSVFVTSRAIEFSSGCALAKEVANMALPPSAIFIASDIIAAGFVLECGRLGWQVPEDIAVAGFDDTALSAVIEPQLTTVRVPQREIGLVAGQVLLDRLQWGKANGKEFALKYEIVRRMSA